MLGILGLVTSGARSYARNRSRQEFRQTYRELSAVETPPLVSATAPARELLLEELRQALADALPQGWTVERDEDLLAVHDPLGPKLLVEVEPPACISHRGRCDEQVSRAFPAYWLIAPVGPQITVLELVGGTYVERVRESGAVFSTTDPFPVTVPLQVR